MPTLPNMSLVTPALNGDSGTWDDKINAAFALVDAHDHTSGKGPRITSAAINITSPGLGFGGFAITAAGQVAFTAVAPLAAGSKALFVSSADDELYWRTSGGTNVQLTDGNSINTSLVGGIVGDYATVGAAVAYDDANDLYTFKQQSGTWARVSCGGVRLHEFNTTESVYVALIAPTALAASYSVAFASALPFGTVLVQIDINGNLIYSNTIAAGSSVTVSGAGDFKHGDKKLCQSVSWAMTVSGAGHSYVFTGAAIAISVPAATDVYIPVYGLREGMRVKSVSVYGTAANEPTISVRLQTQGTAAARATTATGTIVANSRKTLTLDAAYTMTGADDFFFVDIAGVTTAFTVYTIQVIYDIP